MISKLSQSDRNRFVENHIPLARRIASAFWARHRATAGHSPSSTQKRNGDSISWDELCSAAYMALVQARDGWDPLQSNCQIAGCFLPSEDGCLPSGQCVHGNDGYTFGAYAKLFVEGACIAALKKSWRKKPIPYTEELLHPDCSRRIQGKSQRPDDRPYEYYRLPDRASLVDGSEYDGGPSSGWSRMDLSKLRQMIDVAIEDGDIEVYGLTSQKISSVIDGLSADISHSEIASKSCVTVKQVLAVANSLRTFLDNTEFGEHLTIGSEPECISIADLAALVTKNFPDDPCQPKRMGEWLVRGWVPGRQTPEGRWIITKWGARIAIRRWGERREQALADLDNEDGSDRVIPMSKKARAIKVVGHVSSPLPEYGGAAIGPIVLIEVGMGRAQSCAISRSGDRFYSANRSAVLSRFDLEIGEDGTARPKSAD